MTFLIMISIYSKIFEWFQSDPSKNRINPFKFGLSKSTDSTKPNINDREIIKILQTIPGLGDKKANQILEKYNSLQEIVKADQDQLAKVVGPGSANAIWSYLNPKWFLPWYVQDLLVPLQPFQDGTKINQKIGNGFDSVTKIKWNDPDPYQD